MAQQNVFAVSLPVGDTVNLSGTTVAARPELAGPILQDVALLFSFTNTSTGATVSGTLYDRVVEEERQWDAGLLLSSRARSQ